MLQDNRFRDRFIFITFVLLIYLPASMLGNVVRLAALGLALLILPVTGDNPDAKGIATVAFCMMLSPFLSGVVVFLFESVFDFKFFMHEVTRMFFCVFLLMAAARLKVKFSLVYAGAIVALVPNFVIQLLQYSGNKDVYSFINNFYVMGDKESVHLLLSLEAGSGFRAGSIFLNPNVYMVIPLICLCIFLQMDQKKRSLSNSILIAGAVLSCLLTGSRTAGVVAVFIMLLYHLRFASVPNFLMLILLLALIVVGIGAQVFSESRSLRLEYEGSLAWKMEAFLMFWQATSYAPHYWLTGIIGAKIPLDMDSEWGHVYVWYGVFGLLWYIGYYRVLYRHCGRVSRFYRSVVVVCALVSCTASVMHCMPIFSFVAAVVLSQIQLSESREQIAETV